MKRILTIFATAAMVTFATAAMAQDGHDRNHGPKGPRPEMQELTVEQRAHMVTDQMDRLLTLTDKQYQKIYKLNLKELKEMEADSLFLGRRGMGFGPGMGPMPGGPGGPGNRAQFERDMAKAGREFTPLSQQQMEQLKEAHEKSRLKKDKKLRKILTEEQYGKWVKAEQERLIKMQQMRERRGRGRGFGPGERPDGPRPDGPMPEGFKPGERPQGPPPEGFQPDSTKH